MASIKDIVKAPVKYNPISKTIVDSDGENFEISTGENVHIFGELFTEAINRARQEPTEEDKKLTLGYYQKCPLCDGSGKEWEEPLKGITAFSGFVPCKGCGTSGLLFVKGTEAKPTQWEYTIRDFYSPTRKEEMGLNGWELCAIDTNNKFYYKRPLKPQ